MHFDAILISEGVPRGLLGTLEGDEKITVDNNKVTIITNLVFH